MSNNIYRDGEAEDNTPPSVPSQYKKEYVSPSSYVQTNRQNYQTSQNSYDPYANKFYNPYTNTWEDRPLNPYTLPQDDPYTAQTYQPYQGYGQPAQPTQTKQARVVSVGQLGGSYRVIWTYVILIGIVAMFGVQMMIQGGLGSGGLLVGFSPNVLLELGGLNQELVRDGEWWRLISVMFLHGGLLHILFNGLALYSFGMEMERVMGGTRFLLIYFLGGLGGSLLSFGLGNYPVSVGASGAIFALLGGMTGFIYRHRQYFGAVGRNYLYNLLFMIAINGVITLSIPNIDGYAHFGGLIVGAGLGYFLPSDYTRKPVTTDNLNKNARNWLTNWWIVPLVTVVLIGLFAFFLSQPFTPQYPLVSR
jgi:membrane associated rhomboid family serine protease